MHGRRCATQDRSGLLCVSSLLRVCDTLSPTRLDVVCGWFAAGASRPRCFALEMDLGQEQRLAACLRAFAQLRAQERTALYNAAAVADGVIAFSVTVDELSQRWDWDLPVRQPNLHVRSRFPQPALTVARVHLFAAESVAEECGASDAGCRRCGHPHHPRGRDRRDRPDEAGRCLYSGTEPRQGETLLLVHPLKCQGIRIP